MRSERGLYAFVSLESQGGFCHWPLWEQVRGSRQKTRSARAPCEVPHQAETTAPKYETVGPNSPMGGNLLKAMVPVLDEC